MRVSQRSRAQGTPPGIWVWSLCVSLSPGPAAVGGGFALLSVFVRETRRGLGAGPASAKGHACTGCTVYALNIDAPKKSHRPRLLGRPLVVSQRVPEDAPSLTAGRRRPQAGESASATPATQDACAILHWERTWITAGRLPPGGERPAPSSNPARTLTPIIAPWPLAPPSPPPASASSSPHPPPFPSLALALTTPRTPSSIPSSSASSRPGPAAPSAPSS